ncbi:HAD family hydrolase [Stieleria varia]|uniref:Phosphoglycolate phosphatase n=1 Tax=Stieleria varia TaxID=2528005 RepID=A0A5C6A3W5_9BACT|nr:HAD hydrolase-like protein [Stieleria varia]TWT94584.1 Phosphoglycolate phosphatase [Stieleria varia]
MRTLFFDIDGTLLITHRAGSGALQQAISLEFQVEKVNMEVVFGGATDRYLLSELLRLNGLTDNEETRGRLRRRYSRLLPTVLKETGGTVLPGVNSLLAELSRFPIVKSAVMTGNFAETGRMKLDHFGLGTHFCWVSGGDLDADRDDLARRTADQWSLMHGKDAVADMIVIGDTPKDVRCARAMGAQSLAVCTGGFTRDELTAAGATWVVDDLEHPSALEVLIP